MKRTDRRQRARVKVPGPVGGSVNLGSDVRVMDLSPDGAMIEHAKRLSPGAICVLCLHLAGVDLRLRGHVAWSQVHSARGNASGEGAILFRSGLHFPDLPERAAAHLRDYLATLSAARALPTSEEPLVGALDPAWDRGGIPATPGPEDDP